jgi:hypothetical protein
MEVDHESKAEDIAEQTKQVVESVVQEIMSTDIPLNKHRLT